MKDIEIERLKENLISLKVEVESLRTENERLKPKGDLLLSKGERIPYVYIDTIMKEKEEIMAENKELKAQISEMKNKLEGERHRVTNLEASEKRRKKIFNYMQSKTLSNQYTPNAKIGSMSIVNHNLKTEIKVRGDKKQRLQSLENLIEAIKAAPDISRVLSLFIM